MAWSKPLVFLLEKHEDSGENGWRQEAQPDFDPASAGFTVAHDVMEHFPGGDGGPVDELRALGALLHVRGDSGYFWGRYFPDPADHLPSDMLEIFRHVFDGMDLPAPPRTCKLDETTEDTIDRVVTATKKLLRSEWGDQKDDIAEGLRLVRRIKGWLRLGYRGAVKRYKDVPGVPYRLCDMFKEIEAEADKHLKHAEEGEKLEVSYDLSEGTVKVVRLYLEDLYPMDPEDD